MATNKDRRLTYLETRQATNDFFGSNTELCFLVKLGQWFVISASLMKMRSTAVLAQTYQSINNKGTNGQAN